jgi:hypothetical protein
VKRLIGAAGQGVCLSFVPDSTLRDFDQRRRISGLTLPILLLLLQQISIFKKLSFLCIFYVLSLSVQFLSLLPLCNVSLEYVGCGLGEAEAG